MLEPESFMIDPGSAGVSFPTVKTILLVLLLALLQTSCNTFIGVGRDLRQLGTGMENLGQRQW